jgi:hypothetical protein
MPFLRHLKQWSFQFILIAGLLTYADSAAFDSLPITEVSSWVQAPSTEIKHSLFDVIEDQFNCQEWSITFKVFNFKSYLIAQEQNVQTAVIAEFKKARFAKRVQFYLLENHQPRIDLSEIEA